MKKLSIIFIFLLSFQSISSADTISEYEEVGLKLGKSLTKIMTELEIIENVASISENKQYYDIIYKPNTSTFPNLDADFYIVTIDINDEELKIVSFTSLEWFKNDFEGCMKKQDIIANKLEKIFKIKKEVHDIVDFSHLYGSGSKWRPIIFEYPIKANTASVLCYHYGDNPEEDNLKIAIHTRKYADFITVD